VPLEELGNPSIADALGRQIGKGRTAEVYRFGEGAVVKLFHPDIAPDLIAREATAGRHVFEQGLPAPEILDHVVIDDRSGIVYRYVAGDSMLNRLQRQPWRMLNYARQLAETHVRIHQAVAPEIAVQTTLFAKNIAAAPKLNQSARQRLNQDLQDLDGNERRLCHGDFHPDNVLMTETGPVVIDWMAASAGDPAADVARTLLLLQVGTPIGNLSLRDRVIITTGRRLFAKLYLDRYCRSAGMAKSRVRRWGPIVAAARLNEEVGEEAEVLLRRAGAV